MNCTIIDFSNYKKSQIQDINLGMLKNNQLCTLASLIADELLLIDKQLPYLQNIKTKTALMKVIEKINSHFRDKNSFQVNFYEFHSIFKIVHSNSLLAKNNTSESKRLCALHQALKPIYNKNKAILEQLESTEVL